MISGYNAIIAENEGKVKGKEGGRAVIRYDRLWQTMKDRGITQYDLYTHHNVTILSVVSLW